MKLQKETITATHGKWYDDACGTAFALELIGERWSLLVVRELMLGPRRFSDIRVRLPSISAKVLTERLAGLEANGVLRRTMLAPPASVQVYELTQWGYAAEPIMQELGRWAAMSSGHDPLLPLSPVSLMLSLRTMFDPVKAGRMAAQIGFMVAGEEFVVEIAAGRLPIRRGSADEGEAVFIAPAAPVIAAMLYANVAAEELERDAGLEIRGDRGLALTFAEIFELPPKLA